MRGISGKSAEHFKLGVTYGNYGYKFLQKDSPFFIQHKRIYTDLFSNRLIIPIRRSDEVISVTSRSLFNDEPKHLHLPGPIKYFFNHDVLDYCGYVVITESPIDAIILHQNKIHAIASMGINGLKAKNIYLLKNKKVFICFDTDENNSGIRAAYKLSQWLKTKDIESRIVILPKYRDKNDISIYFKHATKNDFLKLIKKSIIPTLKIKWHKEIKSIDCNQYDDIIICPFHADTKPSLVLYRANDSYYCFGCGAFGKITQLQRR